METEWYTPFLGLFTKISQEIISFLISLCMARNKDFKMTEPYDARTSDSWVTIWEEKLKDIQPVTEQEIHVYVVACISQYILGYAVVTNMPPKSQSLIVTKVYL